MSNLPSFEQFGKQRLRCFPDDKELRLWIEFSDGFRKVVLTIQKVLPAIGPYASVVDIVWVPRPDGVETRWAEVQGSFESWRVVEAQIGPKPVYHSGFRHWVASRLKFVL